MKQKVLTTSTILFIAAIGAKNLNILADNGVIK
jgi:hypothetical protein